MMITAIVASVFFFFLSIWIFGGLFLKFAGWLTVLIAGLIKATLIIAALWLGFHFLLFSDVNSELHARGQTQWSWDHFLDVVTKNVDADNKKKAAAMKAQAEAEEKAKRDAYIKSKEKTYYLAPIAKAHEHDII